MDKTTAAELVNS